MATGDFYDSAATQNIIKTRIVSEYFGVWAKIILSKVARPGTEIAYVDLFSGPGRFDDGTESTPLWVLRQVLNDDQLCERLRIHFNDKNTGRAAALKRELVRLEGIEKLSIEPIVTAMEVGPDVIQLVSEELPTLYFIDPWGFKGLSMDLLGRALAPKGSDLIFFFNFNQINRSITNESVSGLIDDLFSKPRADDLRERVKGLTGELREAIVLEELRAALTDVGGIFTLPFKFSSRHGDRTSHYVIFVTRDFTGLHIMRDIMYSVSSDEADIRSLYFNPKQSPQLQLLANFGSPLSIANLSMILLERCAGMTLKVGEAYRIATSDNVYRLPNVKSAIKELEEAKVVVADPPATARRKGTIADRVRISFPTREG